MPISDGLNSKIFQWVSFRGIVGKLAAIAISAPMMTLTPIGLWRPDLMAATMFCDFGVIVLSIAGILWYGHTHPLSATLEGAYLVRHHQQEIKAQIKAQSVGAFVLNEARSEVTLIPGTYVVSEPMVFGVTDATKLESIVYNSIR